MNLIQLLMFAITFYLFYNIIVIFFPQPSTKTTKTLSRMKNSLTLAEKMYLTVVKPLAKLIAPLIPLDEYTEKRLRKNLARVGIDLTPKEYYAKAVITTVFIQAGAVGIHLLLRSIPVTICMVFLGTLMFFQELQSVNKKLDKLNDVISLELPSFIISFAESLQGTRDIEKIFSRYRKICGDAFKYDLDVLISELKHGEHEVALRNFDDRLNIPHVTSFVNSVINVEKGGGSQTEELMFRIQVESMNELQKANIRKELAKRPEKIRYAIYSIGFMILLILAIPIFLNLKHSLGIFN